MINDRIRGLRRVRAEELVVGLDVLERIAVKTRADLRRSDRQREWRRGSRTIMGRLIAAA